VARREIDLTQDAEQAAGLAKMGRGVEAMRPGPPPDEVARTGHRRRRGRELPPRATYYLPPEVQDQVKELAAIWHVPQSDVVRLALERLVEDWKGGKLGSVSPQAVLGHSKLSLYPDG